MISEIQSRLAAQKLDLIKNRKNLTIDDMESIVFGEDDVVENYLSENDINEEDVALEDLRDLQHIMINDLKS